MKKLNSILILLIISVIGISAQYSVVEWSVDKSILEEGIVSLEITATLDKDWKLYSQHTKEGGPIPTSFSFDTNDAYELIGDVEESKNVETKISDMFGIEVSSFKKKAVFTQKIRVLKPGVEVSGNVRFMLCDNEKCLPPTDKHFSIIL